jgi:hypothetical protein
LDFAGHCPRLAKPTFLASSLKYQKINILKSSLKSSVDPEKTKLFSRRSFSYCLIAIAWNSTALRFLLNAEFFPPIAFQTAIIVLTVPRPSFQNLGGVHSVLWINAG